MLIHVAIFTMSKRSHFCLIAVLKENLCRTKIQIKILLDSNPFKGLSGSIFKLFIKFLLQTIAY